MVLTCYLGSFDSSAIRPGSKAIRQEGNAPAGADPRYRIDAEGRTPSTEDRAGGLCTEKRAYGVCILHPLG
jgi:hypothetical protein